MYALSKDVWFLIVGRGVMGMGGGLSIPALHTYMGEMGTVMDQVREKQGKKPRKFAVYIAFSFIMNGGCVVAFVFTSIVAQFPNVNPYHWPGWLMLSLAATQGLAILVLFWEPRPFTTPKIPHLMSLSSSKLSFKLTGRWKRFFSYVFLIGCGYISGQFYALIFTLVTLILNDQFGFTVEYTSHFLIGVSVAFCLSSFIQLGVKMAKMDNRNVLGLLLLLALSGSLVLGDWQSLGQDPCSITNITTIDDYDSSGALPTSESTSYSGHNATGEFLSATEGSVIAREMCEALGDTGHRCFWNPQSRVTGVPCYTCLPVCLSRAKSLCFYQFSLGVLLISIATPLLFVFTSVISSDMMPVGSQGTILTLVLSSGTVSRGVSPYWCESCYCLVEGLVTLCA
jgi:MFS family permease